MEFGFLTRRGKRMLATGVVWAGWSVGALLLASSVIWDAVPPRVIGLGVLLGAATWTMTLVVHRQSDVVRAAFEMGREEGRASVRSLR